MKLPKFSILNFVSLPSEIILTPYLPIELLSVSHCESTEK